MTWEDRAECRLHPASWWFSDDPATRNRAHAICEECPVSAPCLAGALERKERFGIWGSRDLPRGCEATEGEASCMRCSVEGCERDVRTGRKVCTKHSYNGSRPNLPPLPSEPLVALVERRGGPTECGATQRSAVRRAYARAKTTGYVTPAAADRLSHALLGCHPCEVWPQWFGPYGVSV